MQTNLKFSFEQNKRLIGILLFIPFILSIPLVAMLFTQEVNWNIFDFIVAGFLLLSTGIVAEIIIRKVKTTQQRLIFLAILFFALFIVWAELAVGIFGTPFAGN
jgi:uncharacterized membrane protein